jgi:hypothetical protein
MFFNLSLFSRRWNGFFCVPKRSRIYYLGGLNFLSQNGTCRVSKYLSFCVDFKNVNLPLWQNTPKHSYFKITDFLRTAIFQAKRRLFWNYSFREHFVTKISLPFWNQRKKSDFLIPDMTHFEKEKNVHQICPNLNTIYCRKLQLYTTFNIFYNKYFYKK